MKISITFLLIFSLFYEGKSLSDKSSSNICDEIALQHDHVNPVICSSKFAIIPSTFSYTIDESIHVVIKSTIPDTTFIGVYLSAEDEKNINVGSWKTSDTLLKSSSCGGLIHNSKEKKTSIDAIWQASSNVVGNIIIKATIIENDNTIYVNCYNITLTPRILNNSSFVDEKDPGPTTTTITLPTTTTSTTAMINTTQTTTRGITTPSPTADVTVNVTWRFDSQANVTNVTMTVHNLKSAEWAAIGLGLEQAMGKAHVFMCKRLANDTIVIHRYINPDDHDHPQPAGSEDGGVFTPDEQQFNNGVVVCQFHLCNFTTQTFGQLRAVPSLSQTTKYHPLFAVGMLDNDNDPRKHAKDSRTAKSDLVQLNQNEVILYKITVDSEDLTFLQVHGIIMIFTWILIASTGALISRYFKNSWTDNLICGKAAWFAVHRFLMSIAAILTTIGFLFVLVFTQGTWVDQGLTRPFVHSIAGVLVISLAFFQPFTALFRCEPDSRYRFIFNYIHAFLGFSTLILSITTLFLATYFRIFKDNKGRIIMIIWTVWIVLIFAVFEIIQSYSRKKQAGSSYTNINASNTTIGEIVENPTSSTITLTRFDTHQEATIEQKSKNILLAIHILVAITLSIILTTLLV